MEISTELVVSGYVALAGGMAALYRHQLKSQARCEANEGRLSKKVDDLALYQRDEMAKMMSQTVELAAVSLPLLDRAVRVLRRHEADHTPTDDQALTIKHPSGETTTFIKAFK